MSTDTLDTVWQCVAQALEPPTVAQVASALDISTSTARRRLKSLQETGRVESLKDGRVTTWRAIIVLKRRDGEKDAQLIDSEDFKKLVQGEPLTARAAPDPITIELSGFAALEVPANGVWQIFAEFDGYREAERTRYRITCLGWTPPGAGPRQVEVHMRTRGRREYQVRVRAMPARQPPKKAQG